MKTLARLIAPVALLVPVACTSGGSDGPSNRVAFSTADVQYEEDAGVVQLTLVLTAPAAGLADDVHVSVADAGTGTATPGADYAAFTTQDVVFPAGSMSGDTQTVDLTLLADTLVEGADETIQLQLESPVNAGLTKPNRITVDLVDQQQATLRFVSGLTATVDEQTHNEAVPIELSLPAGVTLAVDVSARCADTGLGDATSGADYTAFPARTVTFPAGSGDGVTSSVSVQVLDDSAPENDESVVLGLSLPSAGAVLGAIVQHELVITDDDTGTLPFLLVTQGPNGTENTLAYDDALDLGSQQVAAGPNAGTHVRLSNQGQQPLTLGAPELGGSQPDDFKVEIESLSAPPPPGDEPTVLGADLVAPLVAPQDAADDPLTGLARDLDVAALPLIANLTAVQLHGFPLPGQGEVTLGLRRLPLPIAPGAVLAVDGVPQTGGLRAALDGVTLWRGSVLERPGSHVFLALSADGAEGFVELPHTADRLVHILTERAAGLDGRPPRLRIALEGQMTALGREDLAQRCAGLRVPPGESNVTSLALTPPDTASLTTADCRLALETDWQLTQKLGGVSQTTTYVTELIAAVSDRYLTDVQATLSIAYLGVYSSASDPWTTPDGPGTTGEMLDEFRAAWNSSGWPAQADLAHFISGASLGGGIAYLNVLCNHSYGYGVSGNINGQINWGSWTGAKGSFTWDFVVVAHELGHNFGANHTHDYCPPLDHCYDNCDSTVVCGQSTIMSYCHTCAGGMNNINLEFHQVVADIMRSRVNASCLGDSDLAGSDWVQYLVRFAPLSATGTRAATLQFTHGATNHTSPFRLQLSGTATP